jgi:hypothetical protein
LTSTSLGYDHNLIQIALYSAIVNLIIAKQRSNSLKAMPPTTSFLVKATTVLVQDPNLFPQLHLMKITMKTNSKMRIPTLVTSLIKPIRMCRSTLTFSSMEHPLLHQPLYQRYTYQQQRIYLLYSTTKMLFQHLHSSHQAMSKHWSLWMLTGTRVMGHDGLWQ